jgi:hypothetical protein
LSGPPAGLCSYYDSESPQPGRRRRPLCHGCDASPSLCATVAVSPTPQNRPDPGISPGGRGLGPAAAAPWPTGPAPAAIVGNAAARHATSTSVNPPHWRRLRETLEISPVIRFLATKLHGWSQVAQGSPAHGYGMMDSNCNCDGTRWSDDVPSDSLLCQKRRDHGPPAEVRAGVVSATSSAIAVFRHRKRLGSCGPPLEHASPKHL